MSKDHRKPTCFLSHSSQDKAAMAGLKNLLVEKTGGTIEFFLSSDGQSIPYGRNWVATLDQALTDTAIMFCFLTPQSVESPWIYFEAGHAYSRKVKVIPVSALGLKFNNVPAALSLLQGFDLANHEGLNNIISTLNDRFDFSFPLSFAKEDYDFILNKTEARSSEELLEAIEKLSIDAPSDGVMIDTIIKEFTEGGHPFTNTDEVISGFGIRVIKSVDQDPSTLRVELAPKTFERYLHIVNAVKAKSPKPEGFKIQFKLSYKRVVPYITLTSLLHDSEITLSADNLAFRTLRLKFDTRYTGRSLKEWMLITLTKDDKYLYAEIRDLLTLLFERGALYSTNIYD